MAHELGYRFRLHRKDLPGTPDLVFGGRKSLIFVHGCFWHRHGCKRTTTPKSNREFWLSKFQANLERDERVVRQLEADGWRVGIVWECQTENLPELKKTMIGFLDGLDR
jgi:DNA mismatch endonuclease (patch repair protein)